MFGFFDEDNLNFLGRLKSTYKIASPFPHIVINDACDPQKLNNVLEFFPDNGFFKYDNVFENKKAQNDITKLNYPVKSLLAELNGSAFVSFLEELTGIDGIIPDPHYRGGGCHEIESGGRLAIHSDFNYHPKLNLERAVNVLLYLNKDWKSEYGGELELWNFEKTKQAAISPLFNRMVIFNSTDESLHGHPEPLKTPEGITRKSIAVYYYKALPAGHIAEAHSTRYHLDKDASKELKALAKEREKFREWKK